MTVPDFATHYYLPERGPFRSLSDLVDLPDGAADPVFAELRDRHRNQLGYRRRFGNDYIARRRNVEADLRALFIARGGQPQRQTPYYLVLGECPWFHGLNDGHVALSIPLAQLNPATTSLTFPDSFIAMTRADKPYFRKQYRLEEVTQLWAEHGLPRDTTNVPYQGYWNTDFELYAELQLWEEPAFR